MKRLTLLLRTATLGLISFAIALALACACRDKPSPEEEVKATVRRAIEGANDRSVSKVVKDALPSFRGPRGQNLVECRQILLGYFMRQGWTRAFERNLDIEVEDSRARAVLDVVLAQGKPVERLEDLLPTQATLLIFELELVLHEGKWRFESAEYEHKRP